MKYRNLVRPPFETTQLRKTKPEPSTQTVQLQKSRIRPWGAWGLTVMSALHLTFIPGTLPRTYPYDLCPFPYVNNISIRTKALNKDRNPQN